PQACAESVAAEYDLRLPLSCRGLMDFSRSREDQPMSAAAPLPTDDFQDAAAAAAASAANHWWELEAAEQASAIYEQLRRLDAKRAKALRFRAGPRGRFRVAGESIRRKLAAL